MPLVAMSYYKPQIRTQVHLTYYVRARGAGGQFVQRSVTIRTRPAPPPVTQPPMPAPSGQPAILSVSVSPNPVPASGGTVTVNVRVSNAVTCTFSGAGVTTLNVPCGSGSGGITLTYGANTGDSAQTIIDTYYVVAQGGGRTTPSRSFTVTQEPPPLPSSLLGYLDVCSPGPDCDYGPIYATYQDYGNVFPLDLGDCSFAAAANWEQIVLGLTPDATSIENEFAAAGGTTAGLTSNALFEYWEQQGINGVIQTGLHRYTTDQADVENSVRDYGAMVVEFQFVANDGFGQYLEIDPGYHFAVVDGFTPEGPLIVTWGQTLQMTWDQWNGEVVNMWGIGAG